MIQKGTSLNISDNTGVKKITCIHLCQGFKKRSSFPGDLIIAAVKKTNPKKQNMKIKKGDVVKALIIRSKKINVYNKLERTTNQENAAIIISNQNKILGTRIFGSVKREFRTTKFLKIVSLAKGIVKF
jgi:large subunit ribosomal protein L14